MDHIGALNSLVTSTVERPGGTSLNSQSTASRVESVSQEFEGVFLSLLIKEMRNSLDGGFFGEDSSDSYGGLFDLYMGKSLAETKPLGIADLMLKQYQKNQAGTSDIGNNLP